ncbi:alpha-2B adrenergic receptor [Labrus mixtus]|uniref:alpha-2B adrenergic receptor n=1 Tax=Labrus mixtus TaxID=508554 RepID=UPI0029C06718|nr:alpha-2B adrenergic receptor [Labrus mixtus]
MTAAPESPCPPELSAPSCNQSTNKTSPYTPQATAAFAIAITSMMVMTIVGNILVIIAVLTSRSLKGAQNLFLVSLAAADILVATLIIPFSLANELQGYWAFSSMWCEIYLALDVLFCTSSIVHLCAIALDRYLSISRPVSYGTKRTPLRIKLSIVVVWLISAVISFPPLLTLDKSKGGDGVCELNSERWYILYSTIGSFFAPCVIMILVYARIYQIAKKHTRHPPGHKQKEGAGGNASMASVNTPAKLSEQSQQNGDQGGSQRERVRIKMPGSDSTSSSLHKPPENESNQDAQPPDLQKTDSSPSIPPNDGQIISAVPRKGSRSHYNQRGDSLADNCSSSGSDAEMEVGEEGDLRKESKEETSKGDEKTVGAPLSKGFRVQVLNLAHRYKNTMTTSSGTKLVPEETPTKQGTPMSRRKAMMNREKKFTFVLAVVMGVFVICWFPFFFTYSLQAVCPETCSIPNPLFKFFFWIGYCNSCLNPLIYTVFNNDFRKAFKRILCRDTKGTFF